MNQPISSSKKSAIAFVAILIIGAFIYFYTLGNPTDSSVSSITETENAGQLEEGAKVLALLNQISSLKLDTTIFDNNIYKTLIDYTVEVPEQNVGRTNPFSPYYIVPVTTVKTTKTSGK